MTDRRLMASLMLLTFVTGLIDAASVLGLGRVFTANMTGSVVFLGFAIAGVHEVSIAGSLVALAGFSSARSAVDAWYASTPAAECGPRSRSRSPS